MVTKAHKLPRGALVDKTHMPPFSTLHLDFHFYNVKSIRGFVSALAAVCSSTSYPFNFPTKSRSPPIEITLYLIRTIRSMGYQVLFIQVDEDGAFARSSEFCQMIVEENIVLQTTGGGNSENNGMVERQNQFDANIVNPSLSTMKILMGHKLPDDMAIEEFWCLALQHGTMMKRRVYNRMRGDSPYFLVHKTRPSAKELVPCSAILTIINPAKNSEAKLKDKAIMGHFCGFGNNIKFCLYWDPSQPRQLKRSYHCIVEDTTTFAQLEKKVFSANSDTQVSSIPPDIQMNLVTDKTLKILDKPFPNRDVKTITITLPPKPTPLGLHLCDDLLYNLPFIQSKVRNSFAANYIPTSMRTNHFIMAINSDAPLTKNYVIQILREIQSSTNRKCTLDLVHRGSADNSTSLSISRVMFDNFPSYLQQKPVISALIVPPTHQHFVTSPVKPDTPKSFFDCIKGPNKLQWLAAMKITYKKNKNVACFSLPFPQSE